MGKIIFTPTGKDREVKDGERIKNQCEDLGVVFGCEDGLCGTCAITVVDGLKNLCDKNEKEKDLFPEKETTRLACQCTLKKGTVKFDIFNY